MTLKITSEHNCWIARPGSAAHAAMLSAGAATQVGVDKLCELFDKVRTELQLPEELSLFTIHPGNGPRGEAPIMAITFYGPRELFKPIILAHPMETNRLKLEEEGKYAFSFKRNSPQGKLIKQLAKGYPSYVFRPIERLRDEHWDAIGEDRRMMNLCRPAVYDLGAKAEHGVLIITSKEVQPWQFKGWETLVKLIGFEKISVREARAAKAAHGEDHAGGMRSARMRGAS